MGQDWKNIPIIFQEETEIQRNSEDKIPTKKGEMRDIKMWKINFRNNKYYTGKLAQYQILHTV